jgi:hypothetical protein
MQPHADDRAPAGRARAQQQLRLLLAQQFKRHDRAVLGAVQQDRRALDKGVGVCLQQAGRQGHAAGERVDWGCEARRRERGANLKT